VVSELKKYYRNIIVVDDCSRDETVSRAKESGATVLRHLINLGQGAALETGDKYAFDNGAEVIVHFDADGQHSAEEISNLISPIERGEADVVLGSRFLSKKNQIPWVKKWLILKPAIFLSNLLTGLWLTDTHNGFRAFSRLAATKISIRQNRMAHASEIIGQIGKNKLRWVESPATIVYKEFGQGFRGGIKILKDLFLKVILK